MTSGGHEFEAEGTGTGGLSWAFAEREGEDDRKTKAETKKSGRVLWADFVRGIAALA